MGGGWMKEGEYYRWKPNPEYIIQIVRQLGLTNNGEALYEIKYWDTSKEGIKSYCLSTVCTLVNKNFQLVPAHELVLEMLK
jgi:hypothetical protein